MIIVAATMTEVCRVPRLDEARERLSAARALIALSCDISLQYAALELRQSVELLIYDKLEMFAQYLPPSSSMSSITSSNPKFLLEQSFPPCLG
jgi:hypothetical protein